MAKTINRELYRFMNDYYDTFKFESFDERRKVPLVYRGDGKIKAHNTVAVYYPNDKGAVVFQYVNANNFDVLCYNNMNEIIGAYSFTNETFSDAKDLLVEIIQMLHDSVICSYDFKAVVDALKVKCFAFDVNHLIFNNYLNVY